MDHAVARVVQNDPNDLLAVVNGGRDLHPIHEEAAITCDRYDKPVRLGKLPPDGPSNTETHRGHARRTEEGPRMNALPVVNRPGPIRAAVDKNERISGQRILEVSEETLRFDWYRVRINRRGIQEPGTVRRWLELAVPSTQVAGTLLLPTGLLWEVAK